MPANGLSLEELIAAPAPEVPISNIKDEPCVWPKLPEPPEPPEPNEKPPPPPPPKEEACGVAETEVLPRGKPPPKEEVCEVDELAPNGKPPPLATCEPPKPELCAWEPNPL